MSNDAHNARFHLANDHVNNGRHEAALEVFRELLKSDMDDAGKSMACLNMAIIHDMMGQVPQAIAAYDRGIGLERRFGTFTICQRKATYCMEKERYEDALAELNVLERSSISDLDKANACLSAAIACEKLGQTGKALHWYERGIRYEKPHHRFAVAEHLAWYHSTKNRNRESIEIYEALLREPSLTEADKGRIKNNINIIRG